MVIGFTHRNVQFAQGQTVRGYLKPQSGTVRGVQLHVHRSTDDHNLTMLCSSSTVVSTFQQGITIKWVWSSSNQLI